MTNQCIDYRAKSRFQYGFNGIESFDSKVGFEPLDPMVLGQFGNLGLMKPMHNQWKINET